MEKFGILFTLLSYEKGTCPDKLSTVEQKNAEYGHNILFNQNYYYLPPMKNIYLHLSVRTHNVINQAESMLLVKIFWSRVGRTAQENHQYF